MIELPEALTLARQIAGEIKGKKIAGVHTPTSPHRFCFFEGDVAEYVNLFTGRALIGAHACGIFVEMRFDEDVYMLINDGVNVRYYPSGGLSPKSYQLKLDFEDASELVFTVAMYGGIFASRGISNNPYYLKNKNTRGPLDAAFDADYLEEKIREVKPSLSAKAFLATEQRFPGLGNGVLQDILLQAGIHPKRKIQTLTCGAKERLLYTMQSTLKAMTEGGGRDTEKDLYGQNGAYKTLLSKNALLRGCALCGGEIRKETYLGGAVYYCPNCQPIEGN